MAFNLSREQSAFNITLYTYLKPIVFLPLGKGTSLQVPFLNKALNFCFIALNHSGSTRTTFYFLGFEGMRRAIRAFALARVTMGWVLDTNETIESETNVIGSN